VKTAAGFLNVESGGTLLIGVDDNGKVLGLEDDYKTMGQSPTRDGYETWLTKPSAWRIRQRLQPADAHNVPQDRWQRRMPTRFSSRPLDPYSSEMA
jgi:predicted HTH transcriptional regulator